MKLHELKKQLFESVSLDSIGSLKDLIDPKTGEYYTSEVNVKNNVYLSNLTTKFPVKFGTIGGSFHCHHPTPGKTLPSLEGAPHTVGKDFDCSGNKLTSLQGAPSTVGGFFNCQKTKLVSLQGIHKLIKKINDTFYLGRTNVKTGGIGLLLIEGLTEIESTLPAFKIINGYIGQGYKGLLLCQEELIEAGLEQYTVL